MTTALVVADLAVGDELPTFERVGDLDRWNRYAAVNDEFVPIHMDDAAGQAAGYPTAFGMGNLQLAQIHCMLRQWMGPLGRINNVAVQYRAAATRGSLGRAGGRITEIDRDGDTAIVSLDVWVVDADGKPMTPGTATVALGDTEQRREGVQLGGTAHG